MKSFAVIGLGRFGSNLAKTLAGLGCEVLGIDENEERVQKVSDLITHAIVGDAQDERVLRSVGIRNFDCVIVALSSDMQSSILVTLMLKELGVNMVVSKAQSEAHARVLTKIGAEKVVFPERDMGVKVAQSLARNNILDYIEISQDYSIVEIMMPKSWAGKTLKELNIRANYGLNVIAVRHEGDRDIEISPKPDEKLVAGDAIVVIGQTFDINKLAGEEGQ